MRAPPVIRAGEIVTPDSLLTTTGVLSKGYLSNEEIQIDLGPYLPPLVRQRWAISGIYLPISVIVSLAAKGTVLKELAVTAAMTVRLLRGNNVIWLAEQSRQLAPNINLGSFEGAPYYHVGNWAFSEDFTHPIMMLPQSGLKLQLDASYAAVGPEGAEPENMDATVTIEPGAVRYSIGDV